MDVDGSLPSRFLAVPFSKLDNFAATAGVPSLKSAPLSAHKYCSQFVRGRGGGVRKADAIYVKTGDILSNKKKKGVKAEL